LKLPRKAAAVRPLPAQPEEILFRVEGKMSTFGGPHDLGMAANEDLALFTKADLQDPKYAYLFLPASPPGTSGLGRRLNPDQYYFACRWNYADTPKEFLRRALARVENPANGRAADARPVDWGPHPSTGRVADLSPGLAAALGLNTDDIVRITISARRAIPVKPALTMKRVGLGSSNPHVKPAIKQFIQSPNHSCRNGARIDKVVLHCTEGSLVSALAEFQKPGGRQVSAHYVIDRNGDIYQMVSDSDRSNHCMGANQTPSVSNMWVAKPIHLPLRRLPLPRRLFAGYLSSIKFRAQISLATILHRVTAARGGQAARISSLVQCTAKVPSLPG
jgi:N-acetylmuramoyl-L-alanine amidase